MLPVMCDQSASTVKLVSCRQPGSPAAAEDGGFSSTVLVSKAGFHVNQRRHEGCQQSQACAGHARQPSMHTCAQHSAGCRGTPEHPDPVHCWVAWHPVLGCAPKASVHMARQPRCMPLANVCQQAAEMQGFPATVQIWCLCVRRVSSSLKHRGLLLRYAGCRSRLLQQQRQQVGVHQQAGSACPLCGNP